MNRCLTFVRFLIGEKRCYTEVNKAWDWLEQNGGDTPVYIHSIDAAIQGGPGQSRVLKKITFFLHGF